MAETGLLSRLHEDASAVPNLDAQVMVVEQKHTYQRYGIGYVGINIPGLTIPYYRHVVNVEGFLAAVGQDHSAAGYEGKVQLRHQLGGKMRKRLMPVSVTASTCRAYAYGPPPGHSRPTSRTTR